jgi:hypothetical protein
VSPPLDPSVENLQVFCDLLESSSPALEAGITDLGRLAQALGAVEGRLANGLHGLAGALDGIDREAETSEAATVGACADLGAAAQDVLEHELADVVRQATSSSEEWRKDLDESGRALDTALQELESDGWSPLDAALESERRDLERWAQEASAALDGIAQAVSTLTTQVEHDVGTFASAVGEATIEPFFDHAYWEPAHAQAGKVDTDVLQTFKADRSELLQELDTACQDLSAVMEGEAKSARDAMEQKAEAAAASIRDEIEQATSAAEAAATALEAAKLEFDKSAIAAEAAEPAAAGLVQLESGIEAAEAKLTEMRAVMEVLGQ